MTYTIITVTNTTTTSSTSFTEKQGICVYKELNGKIKTIEQTLAIDKNNFTKGVGVGKHN